MVQYSGTTAYSISIKRLRLLNRYYKITQFYSFLKDTALKGGIVIVTFVTILLALEYLFLDFNALLNNLVATYSAEIIFSLISKSNQ